MAGEITPEEWGRIWAKAWLDEMRGDATFKELCDRDPALAIDAVRVEFKLQNTKVFDLPTIIYNSGTVDPWTVTDAYLEEIITGEKKLALPRSTWHRAP